VDPKIAADQMGHSVDVNQNVYTQTSIERRREAVNSLEAFVTSAVNGANGAEVLSTEAANAS
jgi:hypothetical protein